MTRVLVVEDDQDIRELLVDSLQDLGYDVMEARDGISGLEKAQAEIPDVMLLDVMMPGLDGFQVLERMMSSPATRSIPVIMVSARGQEQDIKDALKIGAWDYMIKPWDPDDLESKVLNAESRVQPTHSMP
ncbi:MAG: response regulator transcription factor [Dehalococcoidia bacterium]